MKTFFSHLFTAAIVYWACGILIVRTADMYNKLPFSERLVMSLDWAHRVYMVREYTLIIDAAKAK